MLFAACGIMELKVWKQVGAGRSEVPRQIEQCSKALVVDDSNGDLTTIYRGLTIYDMGI